jgi:hypothetical protein
MPDAFSDQMWFDSIYKTIVVDLFIHPSSESEP